MKVKCEYCGDEFEAKRSTAKYCLGKPCKTYADREEQTREQVSVTKPEVSVTPDDEIVTLTDIFHGHKVSVTVPASWQADKQAAELVKAKIPHYPTEAVEGRYDRDKVADIW